MTTLNPYLTFSGNCREAMTFYKDCLGGELVLMTVGDSVVAADMPAEMQDSVMHSSLTAEGFVLMASDNLRPEKAEHGNTVVLMLNLDSEPSLRRLYDALSEGGKALDEPHETFWDAVYGSLMDKYGFVWALNYEKSQTG